MGLDLIKKQNKNITKKPKSKLTISISVENTFKFDTERSANLYKLRYFYVTAQLTSFVYYIHVRGALI